MRSTTISNGFALFSMFFGAGNITFPLVLGLLAGGNLPFALLGFVLTAVCIPFSGLIAISLFNGNYKSFFYQMGKIPGFLIITFLIALIGPFAGIPRCITLTFSTLHVVFPQLSLLTFSVVFCSVIFLFTARKNRIVGLIGNYLTPALLGLLLLIIVKGVFFGEKSEVVSQVGSSPFFYGLVEGYNTMDLLASFFFSSLVCDRLKAGQSSSSKLLGEILKASSIGAGLLALVYVGFSHVAANYSSHLAGLGSDRLLGSIGGLVLGEWAGAIVCLSVALTCLTTAIALTAISAEFVQKELFHKKIPFSFSIAGILSIAFFVSTLGFTGIIQLFLPLLEILYPLLVIFCLLSIALKVYKKEPKATGSRIQIRNSESF